MSAAASLLRFREEGARRATLQAHRFPMQMRLIGVSGFDGESTDVDTTRLRADTGYRPEYDVERAVPDYERQIAR